MGSILQLIHTILQLYSWVVIASAVLSWLLAFNVVNPRNQFVGMIGSTLYKLTEPVLRPIRRILPDLGGLDLSPIVLILGIWLVQSLIVEYGSRLIF